MSTQQGSTGNVIAALASLLVPGLGQLLQGRVLWALFWFCSACIFTIIFLIITFTFAPYLGWFGVGFFSCIQAAWYKGPRSHS